MADASDFCAAQVREFARDRYLATLFAPAAQRADLFALHAFDVEIGRIPTLVREPMAGEVRLQWWHEVVHGMRADEAAANPVAAALLATLLRHPDIDRASLLTALDARTADLYADPIETVAALERYAGETTGAILLAAMQVLSPDAAARSSTLSGNAAFVLTVGDIVKHFARDAGRGKTYIPRDVAERHGIALDRVPSGDAGDGVLATLRELAADARARSAEMFAGAAAVAPALLPACVVPLYLDRIARPGFDPYHDAVDVPQWRRQWTMWRAARRFR